MIEFDNLKTEIDNYVKIESKQNSIYEKSEKKSDNYIIPSIPNVETICKTIFQKADQIEQIIMEIVVEFYPNKGLTKQSHFPNMKEELKEEYGEEDNAIKYIEGIVELMAIIRSLRNGLDHRLNTVEVKDYEVQADSNITCPTIELKHKQHKLERIHLNEFLPFMMGSLTNVFENMLAIIADKNIREPNVLAFRVRQKPLYIGKYKNVKYALWSPAGENGFYNLN